MPEILIKNNGQRIEAIMVRSLLVTLQINNIPIKTLCGGKAMCGKCVIRIVKGLNALSPKYPRELQRLAALSAEDDMRLACQTYPGRDIEIEIINFGG